MQPVIFADVVRLTALDPDRRGINPSYRAEVQVGADTWTVIAKLLPAREVWVECVCALVGRALGLPVPTPLVLRGLNDETLFGSEQMNHPDLRRCGVPEDQLGAQLAAWRPLPAACAFDAWIANTDRHGGNLLTDGLGAFWLIDHGLALPSGMAPGGRSANLLLDFARNAASDDLKRRRLVNALRGACTACANLPLDGLLSDCPADMLPFLQTRLPALWPLLRFEVTGNHELPGL
jgi:hypothetical protein